jgi:hypothetical protein
VQHLQFANHLSSGNHWAFESEIFWKARGDNLYISTNYIACVFKKLYEANARWYDAGERVKRNAQHARTLRQAQGERFYSLQIQ